MSVRPLEPDGPGGPGGTIRAETQEDVDFLDPGLAYGGVPWQVFYATCAKLTNYPDERGPAAARLSPELAEALPRPTDGGRTYTFRIREGFRFAPGGEPVTARTLRYSIERTLNPRMRSPGARLMGDLVGAEAYASGRTRHIAGVTASGNNLTIRIERPASNLLLRLSLPFFCAVPLGTPIDPDGLRKVPSAGPYFVSSHVPGEEIVLRRNPHYRGPRPQRPDEVRIAVGAGQAGTLGRVERGEVDYAPSLTDPAVVHRLQARYGAGSGATAKRYVVNSSLGLDFIHFNTSRPPFSSARLRRAVNYALDRRALARVGLSNNLPGSPTDQYLSPAMPGFRDARIYPRTPDLREARRLAGSRRRTVVLYAFGEPSHLRFAEIVKANLRAIGIDVEVRNVGQTMFSRIERRGEPFDMAIAYWVSDYPDPMDFLGQLDGRTIGADDNTNFAYFDDPAFNRKLDAANRLRSPARELALGRLDVELARTEAPWAPVANHRVLEFFSARMGCQVYNPVFGLDLAALCMRS